MRVFFHRTRRRGPRAVVRRGGLLGDRDSRARLGDHIRLVSEFSARTDARKGHCTRGPRHERSVSLCLSPRRCRENENLEGRSRPWMRVWERHKLTRGVSDSSWICRVCFQGPCIYLTGPAVAGGQFVPPGSCMAGAAPRGRVGAERVGAQRLGMVRTMKVRWGAGVRRW